MIETEKANEVKEDTVPLLQKETSEESTQTFFTAKEKNEDRPPPYDNAKGFRDEAAATFDFLHTGATMLLETGVWTLFMIMLLALPIISVVLGVLYKDQCPKQRFIPIYLIVAGSFSIVRQSIDLFERFNKDERNPEYKNLSCNMCKCIQGIINMFLFCWFIAGSVWIYSAYQPNFHDERSDQYCHKTLYLFAFWLTTAVYILMAFLMCCGCCVASCVIVSTACSYFKNDDDS